MWDEEGGAVTRCAAGVTVYDAGVVAERVRRLFVRGRHNVGLETLCSGPVSIRSTWILNDTRVLTELSLGVDNV